MDGCWVASNYSIWSRNYHRNDANYVEKFHLDSKRRCSLTFAPGWAKATAFEHKKHFLAKKAVRWRQKSALGSIRHLLQFFPLIRSKLAGTFSPVTVWLASRSKLYLFTIWHVKCSTRHKSSSFGVPRFRLSLGSVMSYQEKNYLTSICLRHCLTRRREGR